MAQDTFCMHVANDQTGSLESQIHKNVGFVAYFRQAGAPLEALLSDELLTSNTKVVQTVQSSDKFILDPKGGPKRLAFSLPESTTVGVDAETMQKDPKWKAVFAGGAANQWTATSGAVVTDLGRALSSGGASGFYVLVESFDQIDSTIYVFPSGILTAKDRATPDNLQARTYQFRASGSANWVVPASLRSAASTIDDSGVTVGIAIDLPTSDVPAALTAIFGAA